MGHVARTGELRNAYKKLRKYQGKKPFGRTKFRWEYNIKNDPTETLNEDAYWIKVA